MKEESIVSRKLIRDHMLSNSLKEESFTITKPLNTSCLSGHRKFQELSVGINMKIRKKYLQIILKLLLTKMLFEKIKGPKIVK